MNMKWKLKDNEKATIFFFKIEAKLLKVYQWTIHVLTMGL